MLQRTVKSVFTELMAEHVQNPSALAVRIAVEFAGIVEVVAHDRLVPEIAASEPLAGVVPALVIGLILAEVRFGPQGFHESGKTFVEPDVSPIFAGDEIAEPLVAEFVRDQVVLAGKVFGSELGMIEGGAGIGGSDGILHPAGDEIIDHDLRVFFPRVVDANFLAEKLDHGWSAPVVHGETIAASLWSVIGDGYASPGLFHFVKFAGEFDEVKESWRGIPVTYYAPKGRGDRLPMNYGRTPAMIELFSKKIGVDYPWEKYAQVMVDDFVAGGMENSSATTNTSASLVHPKLAPEYFTGEDDLISHELGHQWFGDLVTCKDWGDVWLNEGFATFMEAVWTEAHFGKDQADYERWNNTREWFGSSNLWNKPIVRHDFDDSSEFDGNAYGKSGWVLYMLRHQLGEDAFYRALKHYLEANRGKNVVTADFAKVVEDATHTNVDQFFSQWLYGAGAPKFDLSYSYDAEKHQVALTVKQTQTVEGRVGLFRVPVEVEITTGSGPKLYNITVAKEKQTFPLPADSAPLMVLFDKGGQVLKSAEFHKEKKEWLYQLKNAADLGDRADAVVALGKMKGDEEVVGALGDTLRNDKAWGVRATAADTLGHLGSPSASKLLLSALGSNDKPWVRSRVVSALGNFKDDAAIVAKLNAVAKQDESYRARAEALQALGHVKTPTALATLDAAVAADSPDGFLRNAALRALGSLGDDKAVPLLLQWSAAGKPIDSRRAAINSLARLQKDDQDITKQIAAYLTEPHFPVRMAAIYALGGRGDATAIPALEALLKSDDLSIEMTPMIKGQIARLKKPADGKPRGNPGSGDADEESGENAGSENVTTEQRLEKLERLLQEMSERLKSMEKRLPPPKQ